MYDAHLCACVVQPRARASSKQAGADAVEATDAVCTRVLACIGLQACHAGLRLRAIPHRCVIDQRRVFLQNLPRFFPRCRVVAFDGDVLVGFCYVEIWSHNRYVVNSGLVVHPDYRKSGLAREIKRKVFNLARDKFPEAKVFGITTSLAVMKINTELGYKPVTFSELTQDDAFWAGCKSCPNYDILVRNERRMCLCTAMLAPSKVEEEQMTLNLTAIWFTSLLA